MTLFHDTVHSICNNEYSEEELEAWSPEKMDKLYWRVALIRNYTIVAVEDNKVIGFGDMEKDGYINRLYTHKDYLRKGVGRAIINKLEERARKKKLRYISLEASKTAIGFYLKLCFLDAGTIVRYKDGVTFENQRMIKFL